MYIFFSFFLKKPHSPAIKTITLRVTQEITKWTALRLYGRQTFPLQMSVFSVWTGFSGQFIFGDRFLIILIKLDSLLSFYFIASLNSSKLYRSHPITVIISGSSALGLATHLDGWLGWFTRNRNKRKDYCRAILNLLIYFFSVLLNSKVHFTRKNSVKNPKKELWFLCNFISLLDPIFAELDLSIKAETNFSTESIRPQSKNCKITRPKFLYEKSGEIPTLFSHTFSSRRNKNLKFQLICIDSNNRKKKTIESSKLFTFSSKRLNSLNCLWEHVGAAVKPAVLAVCIYLYIQNNTSAFTDALLFGCKYFSPLFADTPLSCKYLLFVVRAKWLLDN